jgi:hypothetical protein
MNYLWIKQVFGISFILEIIFWFILLNLRFIWTSAINTEGLRSKTQNLGPNSKDIIQGWTTGYLANSPGSRLEK